MYTYTLYRFFTEITTTSNLAEEMDIASDSCSDFKGIVIAFLR